MLNFNRLVDRILAIESGKQIVGQKSVSGNEAFFTGHFPDRSVMPGVLILETIIQAAALLLSPDGGISESLHLTGIHRARFLCPVVPGDILIVSATLTNRQENIGWVNGDARVSGKLVCDMSFSFLLGWDRE